MIGHTDTPFLCFVFRIVEVYYSREGMSDQPEDNWYLKICKILTVCTDITSNDIARICDSNGAHVKFKTICLSDDIDIWRLD